MPLQKHYSEKNILVKAVKYGGSLTRAVTVIEYIHIIVKAYRGL